MQHSIPLVIAAAYGREEVCQLLTTNSADPLLPDGATGMTAIHVAARRSDHEVLRILLESVREQQTESYGHKLDRVDRTGRSALHHAARGVEVFDPTRYDNPLDPTALYSTPKNLKPKRNARSRDDSADPEWRHGKMSSRTCFGGFAQNLWRPAEIDAQDESVRCIELLLDHGACALMQTRSPRWLHRGCEEQDRRYRDSEASDGQLGRGLTAVDLAARADRVDVLHFLATGGQFADQLHAANEQWYLEFDRLDHRYMPANEPVWNPHRSARYHPHRDFNDETLKLTQGKLRCETADATKQSTLRSIVSLLEQIRSWREQRLEYMECGCGEEGCEDCEARPRWDDQVAMRAAAAHAGQRRVDDYFAPQ